MSRWPRGAVVFGGALTVLLAASVVVPLVWPHGPQQQNLANRLVGPVLFGGTWEFPLGTDHLGRDILARILAGARVTLLISGGGVVLAALFGSALGLLGGYYRRFVDPVLLGLTELQMSFPGLLMAILLFAMLGPSPLALIGFLWYQGWPVFGRAVRGQTMSLRTRAYVEAARGVGAGDVSVLTYHIAPGVAATMGVIAALELAYNMLIESALSFLGFGVQPPSVSWGLMLAEGREYMTIAWWTVVFPGLAIVLAVLSVMGLVESLRRGVTDVRL